MDLILRRCSQHFDDLDELVNAGLAGEEGLADKKLSDNTANRPDVYSRSVVCGAENEFWSAIVPGTYVAHIDLTSDQALGRTEITDLQGVTFRVHQ